MDAVNQIGFSNHTLINRIPDEEARLNEAEASEERVQNSNDNGPEAPVFHSTLRGRAEVAQTPPRHRISLDLGDLPDAIVRDSPFRSISQDWRSAEHIEQMASMRSEAASKVFNCPDPGDCDLRPAS